MRCNTELSKEFCKQSLLIYVSKISNLGETLLVFVKDIPKHCGTRKVRWGILARLFRNCLAFIPDYTKY